MCEVPEHVPVKIVEKKCDEGVLYGLASLYNKVPLVTAQGV